MVAVSKGARLLTAAKLYGIAPSTLRRALRAEGAAPLPQPRGPRTAKRKSLKLT